MWQNLLQQIREAGVRKIVILIVAAIIAILLAFGANSTNNAATGRTLPAAHSRAPAR